MDASLNPNPITHVVLTPAGTHHLISQRTNDILARANLEDMIELDDKSKIKLTMATVIVPLAEYYDQFPDKRPKQERFHEPVSSYNSDMDFRSVDLSRNGLASMIKGIKRAIAEYRREGKESLKALELLAKAEKSYNQKYNI